MQIKRKSLIAMGALLAPFVLAQKASADGTQIEHDHTKIIDFASQEGHEDIDNIFKSDDFSSWQQSDMNATIVNHAGFNGQNYTITLKPWNDITNSNITCSYAINVSINKDGDNTAHTYTYPTGTVGKTSYLNSDINNNTRISVKYSQWYTKKTSDGNTIQAAVGQYNGLKLITFYRVTTDGLIEHYFMFKNETDHPISTGNFGVSHDTDLDGNDQIPIIADGYGGTYIQNNALTLWSMPITSNVKLYATKYYNEGDTSTPTINTQRGSILRSNEDTNLAYHFDPTTIQPGQSVTFAQRESLYPAPLDPLHQGEIVIKYVDRQGNEIAPRTATFGSIGSDYALHPKDIEHWKMVAKPEKDTIKYDRGQTTATYIYEHGVSDLSSDKAVKRTIKYEMAGGDSTKKPADTVQTGHATQKGSKDEVTGQVTMGDWVNGKLDALNVPHIDGYTSNIQSIPEMAVTKDTPAESTVTVTYTPDDEHVKVRYIDQDGKDLTNADTLTGKMDSEYHTQAKQIDGYKVTKVPANANGKYGTQNADIVYQYEPDIRKINVHYVDENGNKLHDDAVIQGKYKSQYTTQPVSIHGWHVKTTPKNASGTYQVTNPDITYIYERNRESAMLYYVDQNGAPMETPEKITGLYGDHYKTSPETFEGYHLTQSPKNAEGVLDDTNADIVYR